MVQDLEAREIRGRTCNNVTEATATYLILRFEFIDQRHFFENHQSRDHVVLRATQLFELVWVVPSKATSPKLKDDLRGFLTNDDRILIVEIVEDGETALKLEVNSIPFFAYLINHSEPPKHFSTNCVWKTALPARGSNFEGPSLSGVN